MNDNQKNFLRKLEIRKNAIVNANFDSLDDDTYTDLYIKSGDRPCAEKFSLLNDNLLEADGNSFQNGYQALQGKKINVFIKKVIRKLLRITMGWYIFPIYSKQSHFNGKIVNTVSLLRDIVYEQQSRLDANDRIITLLTERLNQTEELLKASLNQISENSNDIYNLHDNLDLVKGSIEIDYFDFENKFRGSRELVMQRQRCYIDYFKINGGAEVLDIGCGRGEFLELMYNHGIDTKGIDVYLPFVEYCNERGFKAEQVDALTYLRKLENGTVGGVFMSQVVEHLQPDYLLALLKEIYLKMKPGTNLIIETPNPESISTYINFYIDLSHIKPVHPATLHYLLEKLSFTQITRINTEHSKFPYSLGQNINDQSILSTDDINKLNEILFESNDYCLIARK